MAKFYIQLENQRLPIGEITRDEVLAALGIDELFNFTGNFYDLDDNPFSNGANGEFNIVDEEGRIIAIVDKYGIHSIEMTAEDESGTVHKLTDKMDRSDFDEIISTDGNNFIIQDEDGNQGFVLTAEGATAHDFITYKGDSLLDIADRVESVESNVGSIDNMISATGNEFIIQDDKANPNVGLKLNSEGLFVKDVTLNNGEHVLSQKADKTYVDDVKSDMTTELNTKINSLDATVSASGRTYGVKVSVAQTNGKLSSVTVDDSAITFTKLVDNPITTESSDFIIQDGNKNYGFVLNDKGAKAKDFTTSTGVSLNGLNNTVVSIRAEVDNINNMISDDEEGALVIKDGNKNIGLKLDSDGLHVHDVFAYVSGNRKHILSEKADQSDVDNVDERLATIEGYFELDDKDDIIDNINDVIDFFASVRESDKGAALLSTVATHTTQISDNASGISSLSGTVSELSTRVSATEKNIVSLSGRVSVNEGAISGLSTTVGNHTTTITTLNSTVASHKKELDGSISDLTSTVASNKDELNGKITALSKTVASNKASLEGSISDLTSTVTSHTSYISTLQTTVASNVSKINSLSGTVSANTAAISNINNITSASATINSNVGTPTVTVSYTGETSNKKLNFEFKNLKGDKGDTGTSVSVSTVTSSSDDEGTNTVTFTDGNKLYVKNGSKGSTGAGISKISKKGTNNLVDTYEITYTDGRTATSFTVTNGAPGTNVTITSVSQNTTAGSYSTVSFSTGDKLNIYNGQNGAKGSDGFSTYYTANTYASDHKTISQGVVTKPSERTIQIGDFILASNGNMFRVTDAGSNLSVDYITSIVGPEGPKGDDGTSVNIKDTLSSTDALADKKNGAVNGDGYIIGENLYVYTGGTTGTIHGFKDVGKIKGPQGETGPQGPEGPAGTSVTIKSLVSSSAPGEASTITFSDDKILKVYNGADGAQGPAGVGISKISKSGETVTITYTDTTTSSFTVNDGVDGTSVTITSVSQNNTAGESSKVTFSDGKSLSIKNGQNGKDGKDGTSVTITSVSQNNTAGESSKVTFSDGKSLSIKNGQNGKDGKDGKDGADGTSVNIKGNVPTEDDLKTISGMVAGDGYIVDETGHLHVYTSDKKWIDAGEIKGPKGDDGITITPKEVDGGFKFIINNVSEGTGDGSGGVFTGDIFYEDILDAPITMDDSGVLDITDDAGYIIAKINSDGITTTKVKAKNGFYQESDETLKDFYDSIEVDFNALKSIPKAYYTWKDEDVMQIGTSAQKVQELYPEIVSLDEKTGKLTLDYAKLSVIALKAIDLLHEENENLKLELKSLHNEMDKIKSHLGL